MDRIKKNFGFGCMRLPMIGEEVDIEQTKQMVDAFLDAGFNYFDTAHGYIQGKSEKALKTCLTSRYPREKYILTDKLTANYFKTEADIRPFFESQLEICGTRRVLSTMTTSRSAARMRRRSRSKKRAKFATSAFPSTTAPRCSSAF